ncbi:MAG: 16S rRNA (adenine(1518)-N(6)/adenine(1519)-N(6))-dimethyltransferase RsmA [Bacteroidales bacterium]|jgi:16S rRNA (adenine1518-N6/adenine1519-N6)-dimethyltransferase|nr:16S rRNA (adenine(1518)-N(6)/adenine(1519)-N(6))-dimethyltransferase RsmA [Bacteroidales bacterium]
MSSVKAKKSFGQHFLKNEDIAHNIAELALKHNVKNCLEIGPGMGVLTKHLQALDLNLKVVEVDKESVNYLLDNHIVEPQNCIEGDFLRLPLAPIFGGEPFCVIGNFPYNISSQIVFRIVEHRALIPGMSGMFQREVARRIASPKGSKEYGIISVLVQAFFTTEYHFTVDEHEFVPPPKVKSGVISLYRKENQTLPCDEKTFIHIVKTGFNQRRKTLRNSLKSITFEEGFTQHEIFNLRPEQLSVDDFIFLTQNVIH